MADFQRIPLKFKFRGLHLNSPVDAMPQGKVPYCKNVRSFQDGRIESRPGLTQASTVLPAAAHSIRRLTNFTDSSYLHLIGTSTDLYGCNLPGLATLIESGFSGKPLSMVPLRPEESPEAWMYVFDGSKLRKVETGGTDYQIGINAPTVRPTAAAGGAGDLDNSASQPYFYRFRYRSTTTGARSNPSPPTVEPGVTTTSTVITVGVTASADAQVDKIDIFRYGGTIAPDGWKHVGTTANSTGSYDDNMSDADAQVQETLDFDNFVPFVTQGLSTGGTCDVSGTSVTATSGTFSTNWPDGTIIIIAGAPTRVCGQPSSTSALTIYDDFGTMSGAVWSVESPYLVGQPLPCAWGPYGGGQSGEVIFAVGDIYRPGALYWTNGNNPDGASDTNYLEITSPSERLQNGCLLDGASFVFSTERMFSVRPAFSQEGLSFTALEVGGGRGLWARWAIAVGPKIWYLSRDGIYETTGGASVCITDEDLYPLFPHEGQAGKTVNGIKPPNMTGSETSLRLSYAFGYLYFDYVASDGSAWSLVYDTTARAWMLDRYLEGTGFSAMFGRYADEYPGSSTVWASGGANAIFSYGGVTDGASTAINSEVWTPAVDAGDSRAEKQWGDNILDCDSGTGNFTVEIFKNNFGTSLAAGGSVGSPNNGRTQQVFDIDGGNGVLALNIGLKITFAAAQVGYLYEWQPSVVVGKPESTKKRATDWTDADHFGRKNFRGIVIEADTSGSERTVLIQKDGDTSTPAATLTVNHTGQLEKPYAFTPFEAHEVRLIPTDENAWKLFKWRWIFDQYPEDVGLTEEWQDAGSPGNKYVYGCIIEADTANAEVSVEVQKDGVTGSAAATLTVQHDGRIAKAYEFAPFLAHSLRLKPGAALKNFRVTWLFDPYPELASFTPDFTTVAGHGARQVRGFILEADTGGAAINVKFEKDGATAQTISVNHNGRLEKPYAVTPTVGHEFRLVPQADWKFFNVRWIYDEWAELSTITTEWDRSDVMSERYCRGVILEADTGGATQSIQVQYDGGAVGATLQANHNGITQVTYAFPVPFIASLLRFVPLGNTRIFRWRWIADVYPNRSAVVTEWENAGYDGAKFVQGLVLTADTQGSVVSVPIQYDEQAIGPTLSVQHSGQVSKPYSFEPFIAHNLRFAPAAAWRYFRAQWVWEPVPEAATTWATQGTCFDADGFIHVRRAFIALMSSATVTLTVNIDGVNYTYTLASTAGAYRKLPVVFRPVKGKLHSFRVESALPLRLFVKDTEVWFKPWGDAGPYRVAKPFGDAHRLAGARI
jgi:hypothetical protein